MLEITVDFPDNRGGLNGGDKNQGFCLPQQPPHFRCPLRNVKTSGLDYSHI
jgi:hypothetical protein